MGPICDQIITAIINNYLRKRTKSTNIFQIKMVSKIIRIKITFKQNCVCLAINNEMVENLENIPYILAAIITYSLMLALIITYIIYHLLREHFANVS